MVRVAVAVDAVGVSDELRYVVEGRPVTWARDNVVKGRYITDERTRQGKKQHRDALRLAYGAHGGWYLSEVWERDGEFEVHVVGYYPNRVHGDADRLLTLVMDALEGLAYEKDRQVKRTSSEIRIDKAHPRVEVTVRRMRQEAA